MPPYSVNVVFVNYKGKRTTLKAEIGKTLLHAAMDNAWPFMDGASLLDTEDISWPANTPSYAADAGNSATNAHRYNKEGDWFEPTYGEGGLP